MIVEAGAISVSLAGFLKWEDDELFRLSYNDLS
jgi:hypothetical protein